MAGAESVFSTSDGDISFEAQPLRKTASQDSVISTFSNVSYQPPERTSTPTRVNHETTKRVGGHAHMQKTAIFDEIRIAILNGHLDKVKELYLAGIDVNSVLNGGWTALMYACSLGEHEIVRFLLDNGADVHAGKDMFTALMAACASRCGSENRLLRCCMDLVKSGAEVHAVEKHQMTPLMFAARENRAALLNFLLERGADINAKDSRQWTALCIAAYAGHLGIVNLLIDHGADPNMITLKGHTAFDIAEINGKRQVADRLKKITKPQSSFQPQGTEEKIKINETKEELKEGNSQSDGGSTNEDLLLFLTDLDLLDCWSLFEKTDFNALLLMKDDDLANIGITDESVRQKIVKAVKDIHTQPWSNENLKQANNFTFGDMKTLLSNLIEHVVYMKTSLAYMTRELEAGGPVLKELTAEAKAELLDKSLVLLHAGEEFQSKCESLQHHFHLANGFPDPMKANENFQRRHSSHNDLNYLQIVVPALIGTAAFLLSKRLF